MIKKNLVIIGGGPAGLAAAKSAYDSGERDIVILERENVLGGILNQCIHNGFGLHTFKEELTGLPPFTILAAEHDTLCQEALEFARKLVEAGVTVTAKKIKGARHGFLVRRTEGYLEGEALFFSALKTYFSDFGKGERK